MNKLTIINPDTKKSLDCGIYLFKNYPANTWFTFHYEDDFPSEQPVGVPVLELEIYDLSKGHENGCCVDWETCGHFSCGSTVSLWYTERCGWGFNGPTSYMGSFWTPVEVLQINYNYSLNKIDFGAWEFPELTILR